MKRKLVIATLTAAVLVGGGTYTAVAVSDDDAPRVTSTGAAADEDGGRDDRDDERDARDDREGREDDRAPASGGVTAAQAAAAALGKTPGAVESVDLDDDGDGRWEVDVLGRDDREHELTVAASDGSVRVTGKDGDSDDSDDAAGRTALRDARIDAGEAIAAALEAHPDATVTSVDFDDEGDDHWEVELDDDRELRIDARSAAVTTD
ncbi:PepSY domain-containing protein [Streptomyces sp. t39]|uniref:PepSY domain-containing protein n=1 Tax=Streptomyces sp. t39 TaxID=1828156 RepID=UPI0011CE31E7|nr:PepSY domain-containing protein [Streptomyces sp. t39]TXS56950.1 peptidase propeptide and YpeB domain protein [Streptomyces sp. t39]